MTKYPYKLFRPYDRAVVDSALVVSALYKSFRPYHIFMRPTANPALYQMEKNN